MEKWEEGDDDAREVALEVTSQHVEGQVSAMSWRQVLGLFRKFSLVFLVGLQIFVRFWGVWELLWVWCQQRETTLYEPGVGRAKLDLMKEQELICFVFGHMLNTMRQILMEPSKSYITQLLPKFSPTIPD